MILNKLVCPKSVGLGFSLDFSSPKTLCLSLFKSILAVQNTFPTIYWYLAEDTLFLAKIDSLVTKHYHHPKMLHLNCQFDLTEIYVILLFTHFYALLIRKKSMLIPHLRYMLTHICI